MVHAMHAVGDADAAAEFNLRLLRQLRSRAFWRASQAVIGRKIGQPLQFYLPFCAQVRRTRKLH
jgi:hypothetical protein